MYDEFGITTGIDLWHLGKTRWLLGKDQASVGTGLSPLPRDKKTTTQPKETCALGDCIEEREYITHPTDTIDEDSASERGHSLISWRFFWQFSPPTYLCWRPDDASRLDLPTYADAWPADVFPVFTFSKLCLVLSLYIFIFEKCQLASGSGTYLPMLTPRWRFLLEPTYLSSRQLINEWPPAGQWRKTPRRPRSVSSF